MGQDPANTDIPSRLSRATSVCESSADGSFVHFVGTVSDTKRATPGLRGAVLRRPAVITPFGTLARHVVDAAGDIVEAAMVVDDWTKASVAGANVLSESVALAWPTAAHDLADSTCAMHDVRKREIPVEVRIGVGPIIDEPPLRVLGFAGRVAEVLQGDVRILVEPAVPRIKLFSSAPKAGSFHWKPAVMSLVALAGALRVAGISNPISIDLAASEAEIPGDLSVDLEAKLADWVVGRALRHRPGEKPSLQYALEHASPTMFGDLTDGEKPPFRITVGGATEAKFWAVRMRVRDAVAHGAPLAPVAGLIIKALRVPWYQPVPSEPPLRAALTPAKAIQALEQAANPARGGNAGLKGETRAVSRLIGSAGVSELIAALTSGRAAKGLACEKSIDLGPRLVQAMGDSE